MNGFKDDVISILRQVGILQTDAIGWIVMNDRDNLPETQELYLELQKKKFPVTNRAEKMVVLFDYIVLDMYHATIQWLLKALDNIGLGSVIVMDISDFPNTFSDRYIIRPTGLSINKVKFLDKTYLVVHSGLDYAN